MNSQIGLDFESALESLRTFQSGVDSASEKFAELSRMAARADNDVATALREKFTALDALSSEGGASTKEIQTAVENKVNNMVRNYLKKLPDEFKQGFSGNTIADNLEKSFKGISTALSEHFKGAVSTQLNKLRGEPIVSKDSLQGVQKALLSYMDNNADYVENILSKGQIDKGKTQKALDTVKRRISGFVEEQSEFISQGMDFKPDAVKITATDFNKLAMRFKKEFLNNIQFDVPKGQRIKLYLNRDDLGNKLNDYMGEALKQVDFEIGRVAGASSTRDSKFEQQLDKIDSEIESYKSQLASEDISKFGESYKANLEKINGLTGEIAKHPLNELEKLKEQLEQAKSVASAGLGDEATASANKEIDEIFDKMASLKKSSDADSYNLLREKITKLEEANKKISDSFDLGIQDKLKDLEKAKELTTERHAKFNQMPEKELKKVKEALQVSKENTMKVWQGIQNQMAKAIEEKGLSLEGKEDIGLVMAEDLNKAFKSVESQLGDISKGLGELSLGGLREAVERFISDMNSVADQFSSVLSAAPQFESVFKSQILNTLGKEKIGTKSQLASIREGESSFEEFEKGYRERLQKSVQSKDRMQKLLTEYFGEKVPSKQEALKDKDFKKAVFAEGLKDDFPTAGLKPSDTFADDFVEIDARIKQYKETLNRLKSILSADSSLIDDSGAEIPVEDIKKKMSSLSTPVRERLENAVKQVTSSVESSEIPIDTGDVKETIKNSVTLIIAEVSKKVDEFLDISSMSLEGSESFAESIKDRLNAFKEFVVSSIPSVENISEGGGGDVKNSLDGVEKYIKAIGDNFKEVAESLRNTLQTKEQTLDSQLLPLQENIAKLGESFSDINSLLSTLNAEGFVSISETIKSTAANIDSLQQSANVNPTEIKDKALQDNSSEHIKGIQEKIKALGENFKYIEKELNKALLSKKRSLDVHVAKLHPIVKELGVTFKSFANDVDNVNMASSAVLPKLKESLGTLFTTLSAVSDTILESNLQQASATPEQISIPSETVQDAVVKAVNDATESITKTSAESGKESGGIKIKSEELITTLNGVVERFINSYLKTAVTSGFDFTGADMKVKNLNAALQRKFAEKLGKDPSELTAKDRVPQSEAIPAAFRDSMGKVYEGFGVHATSGMTSLAKHYKEVVKDIEIAPDDSLRPGIIKGFSDIQSTVITRAKKIVQEQFDAIKKSVKDIKKAPVGFSASAPALSAPPAPKQKMSYGARGEVPMGRTIMPLPFSTGGGADVGGPQNRMNYKTMTGAILNTLRYITSGMIVGAPYMAFNKAFTSAKGFDLELAKGSQNILGKDRDMLTYAKQRIDALYRIGEISDKEYIRNREKMIQEEAYRLRHMARDGAQNVLQGMALQYLIPQEELSSMYRVSTMSTKDPTDALAITNVGARLTAFEPGIANPEELTRSLQAMAIQWKLSPYELQRYGDIAASASVLTRATAQDIIEAQKLTGATMRMNMMAGSDMSEEAKEDAFKKSVLLSSLLIESAGITGNQSARVLRNLSTRVIAPDTIKMFEEMSAQPEFEGLSPYKVTYTEDGLKKTEQKPLMDIFLGAIDTSLRLRAGGNAQLADEVLRSLARQRDFASIMALAENIDDLNTSMVELGEKGVTGLDDLLNRLDATMAEENVTETIIAQQQTLGKRLERLPIMWEVSTFSIFDSLKHEIGSTVDEIAGFLRLLRDNAEVFADVVRGVTTILVGAGVRHFGGKFMNKAKEKATRTQAELVARPYRAHLAQKMKDIADRELGVVTARRRYDAHMQTHSKLGDVEKELYGEDVETEGVQMHIPGLIDKSRSRVDIYNRAINEYLAKERDIDETSARIRKLEDGDSDKHDSLRETQIEKRFIEDNMLKPDSSEHVRRYALERLSQLDDIEALAESDIGQAKQRLIDYLSDLAKPNNKQLMVENLRKMKSNIFIEPDEDALQAEHKKLMQMEMGGESAGAVKEQEYKIRRMKGELTLDDVKSRTGISDSVVNKLLKGVPLSKDEIARSFSTTLSDTDASMLASGSKMSEQEIIQRFGRLYSGSEIEHLEGLVSNYKTAISDDDDFDRTIEARARETLTLKEMEGNLARVRRKKDVVSKGTDIIGGRLVKEEQALASDTQEAQQSAEVLKYLGFGKKGGEGSKASPADLLKEFTESTKLVVDSNEEVAKEAGDTRGVVGTLADSFRKLRQSTSALPETMGRMSAGTAKFGKELDEIKIKMEKGLMTREQAIQRIAKMSGADTGSRAGSVIGGIASGVAGFAGNMAINFALGTAMDILTEPMRQSVLTEAGRLQRGVDTRSTAINKAVHSQTLGAGDVIPVVSDAISKDINILKALISGDAELARDLSSMKRATQKAMMSGGEITREELEDLVGLSDARRRAYEEQGKETFRETQINMELQERIRDELKLGREHARDAFQDSELVKDFLERIDIGLQFDQMLRDKEISNRRTSMLLQGYSENNMAFFEMEKAAAIERIDDLEYHIEELTDMLSQYEQYSTKWNHAYRMLREKRAQLTMEQNKLLTEFSWFEGLARRFSEISEIAQLELDELQTSAMNNRLNLLRSGFMPHTREFFEADMAEIEERIAVRENTLRDKEAAYMRFIREGVMDLSKIEMSEIDFNTLELETNTNAIDRLIEAVEENTEVQKASEADADGGGVESGGGAFVEGYLDPIEDFYSHGLPNWAKKGTLELINRLRSRSVAPALGDEDFDITSLFRDGSRVFEHPQGDVAGVPEHMRSFMNPQIHDDLEDSLQARLARRGILEEERSLSADRAAYEHEMADKRMAGIFESYARSAQRESLEARIRSSQAYLRGISEDSLHNKLIEVRRLRQDSELKSKAESELRDILSDDRMVAADREKIENELLRVQQEQLDNLVSIRKLMQGEATFNLPEGLNVVTLPNYFNAKSDMHGMSAVGGGIHIHIDKQVIDSTDPNLLEKIYRTTAEAAKNTIAGDTARHYNAGVR